MPLPATSPKAELWGVAALERWLETVGATGPVFWTFDLRGRLTENRLDPGNVARCAGAPPRATPALPSKVARRSIPRCGRLVNTELRAF